MLAPKGRVERLQRRALSRLCSLCSRPSRSLGIPFSRIITIPTSIYWNGDSDNGLSGVPAFEEP